MVWTDSRVWYSTQPNPTHGWTQPMSISALSTARFCRAGQLATVDTWWDMDSQRKKEPFTNRSGCLDPLHAVDILAFIYKRQQPCGLWLPVLHQLVCKFSDRSRPADQWYSSWPTGGQHRLSLAPILLFIHLSRRLPLSIHHSHHPLSLDPIDRSKPGPAQAQPRLKSWRGPRVGWIPPFFPPPSISRLPSLLRSCYTHSLPFCSFLLLNLTLLNLRERSGKRC